MTVMNYVNDTCLEPETWDDRRIVSRYYMYMRIQPATRIVDVKRSCLVAV